MANFRVLGCSGGIGDSRRTSSFLLNESTLIDAGTGVGDLLLQDLCEIRRVFLTHSHLDHISHLPFLIDSVQSTGLSQIEVYGIKDTLLALKNHIFNNQIWPDFSSIPSRDDACLLYRELEIYQPIRLSDDVIITAIPATHSIPACGYHMQSDDGSLIYTGDSVCNSDFWKYLNECSNLRHLIIETSFLNSDQEIAQRSYHLTPTELKRQISQMTSFPEIHITHLKPGSESLLMAEIVSVLGRRKVHFLKSGDELIF